MREGFVLGWPNLTIPTYIQATGRCQLLADIHHRRQYKKQYQKYFTMSTTTTTTTTISITTGGGERIAQAANLYQHAFRDDPVMSYMLCNLTTQQRHAYLREYFTRLNTAAALNAGVFEEADDWASALVFLPPGHRIDNPWTLIPAGIFQVLWKLGIAGCNRMLREFEPAVKALQRKELGDSTHFYYLFIIATRDDARRRGLSSALARRLQERAAKEDAPVWLEATTEASARLYAKWGFKSVGKVILGKAVAAPDGSRQQGGAGVPVDCMIWRPGKEELRG
jgi:GNAT superfamily N-acetyltransferase